MKLAVKLVEISERNREQYNQKVSYLNFLDLNLLTIKQGNQITRRKIVDFDILLHLSVRLQPFTYK